MASYVPIYGQPVALNNDGRCEAILVFDDDGKLRVLSPDLDWHSRVDELVEATDRYEATVLGLTRWIASRCNYYRFGNITNIEQTPDLMDVLERIYFS